MFSVKKVKSKEWHQLYKNKDYGIWTCSRKRVEQHRFLPDKIICIKQDCVKWKENKKTKVYIGCAKWERTECVGKNYPPKIKEKDFLQHYVEHYNWIELNATHYRKLYKD